MTLESKHLFIAATVVVLVLAADGALAGAGENIVTIRAGGGQKAPKVQADSIYDHFAIKQIVAVTVSHALTNWDFSAADAASVTKKDLKLITELASLLKALPASGVVDKLFGRNVPLWRIDFVTKAGKKHALTFYGVRLAAPDGRFYGTAEASALEKKLFALIATKFNPRKIDRQFSGTHTWGQWKYGYTISHRGGKSEKRRGALTYGGREIPGAAKWDRIHTPWGQMQFMGAKPGSWNSGWLLEFTHGRPIDRTKGRRLLAGQAPDRVKLLKRHIEKFVLVVRYYGPKDKGRYSLTLRVPAVWDQRPPFWPAAQLSKAQAEKIIDHLDTTGILAVAGNLHNKGFEPPKGPTYALTVTGPNELLLYEPLGWDLKMLNRLDALRKVLDKGSGAGKAMDKVTKALEPQRKKWQKAASAEKKTAERAKLLKKNISTFWLLVEYYGPQDDRAGPRCTLWLTRPPRPRPSRYLPTWLFVEINRDLAAALIDHSAGMGLLASAADVVKPGPRPKGPAYVLWIGCKERMFRQALGWDLNMLKRLDALRKVLTGDAAKAMGKLLKTLEPQRKKWRAQAQVQSPVPAGGPWAQLPNLPELKKKATARAKLLKKDIDSFRLHLTHVGENRKPTHAVTLSVRKPAPAKPGGNKVAVRVTKEQAAAIIDYLEKKACLGYMMDSNLLKILSMIISAPHLHVHVAAGKHSFEAFLGNWTWANGLVDGVRKVLPGDGPAAKELDKLTKALGAQRKKWAKGPFGRAAGQLGAALQQLLKSQVARFVLEVRYYGPQDKTPSTGSGQAKPFFSLTLSVPGLQGGLKRSQWAPAVQISKAQALKIIDHLHAAGTLNNTGNLRTKGLAPPKGPTYSLIVKGLPQLPFHEPLSWDLNMLKRLDALRKVLDGDAAKAMDKVLKALEPQREKWQKVEKQQAIAEVQDLVAEMKKRMAATWQVHSVGFESSTADNWPKGNGVEIRLQRKGFKPVDAKLGLGGGVSIVVMIGPFVPPRAVGAQAGNVQDLGPWRAYRVFAMGGGGKDWPTWREDIKAGIKRTQQRVPAEPAVKWGKAVNGLVCGISAFKPKVQLGAPYQIEVSIKNISKGDILLLKQQLEAGKEPLHDCVYFMQAGTTYREFFTHYLKGNFTGGPVRRQDFVLLRPGDIYKFTHGTLVYTGSITNDLKKAKGGLGLMSLTREGAYQMQVRYQPWFRLAKGVDLGLLKPWKGVLVSAPVEVVVGKAPAKQPARPAAKARKLFDKADAENFALTLSHSSMRGVNVVGLSTAKPISQSWYGHTLQISNAEATKIMDYMNKSTWPVWPDPRGVKFADDESFIVAAQSGPHLVVVDLRWGAKTLKWVKGLQGTLQDPAAKAVGKMTAAMEHYVRGVAQPMALAKLRATPVKGGPKKFSLHLQWTSRPGFLGSSKPSFYNLALTVGKPPKAGKQTLSAQIIEAQAGKIVDHLLKSRFYHRAVGLSPMRRQILSGPFGAAYTLTVWHGLGWGSVGNLGCGPRMLERLDALRKVLPENSAAAKAMDKLLASLAPARKRWKAESAMKPVQLAAHRSALLKKHSAAFRFSLACMVGPGQADRSWLTLSVPQLGKVQLPKGVYQVQITEAEAGKVIDYMATEGYLTRAVCIPFRSGMVWSGPALTVSTWHPDGYTLTSASAWRAATLRKSFGTLQKALPRVSGAAKVFGALMTEQPAAGCSNPDHSPRRQQVETEPPVTRNVPPVQPRAASAPAKTSRVDYPSVFREAHRSVEQWHVIRRHHLVSAIESLSTHGEGIAPFLIRLTESERHAQRGWPFWALVCGTLAKVGGDEGATAMRNLKEDEKAYKHAREYAEKALGGEWPPAVKWGKAVGGLVCGISAFKKNVQLGAPYEIEVSIKNISKGDILILRGHRDRRGRSESLSTRVILARGGKQYREYCTVDSKSMLVTSGAGDFVRLKPSGIHKFTHRTLIARQFHRKKPEMGIVRLKEGGRYHMQVSYQPWIGRIAKGVDLGGLKPWGGVLLSAPVEAVVPKAAKRKAS
jgi:hypothetical protein